MSLASEDDLNGTVRIAEDAREAFGVTQEQRGALVRDKTSDEANSERIRVEERIRGRETRRIGTAAGKLLVAANTDRKSTRLNSSHLGISYAVFCLKKKQ